MTVRLLVHPVFVTAFLLLAACSPSSPAERAEPALTTITTASPIQPQDESVPEPPEGNGEPAQTQQSSEFGARGSIGRVTVTGAMPGELLELTSVSATIPQTASEDGTAAWLNLGAGDYVVTGPAGDGPGLSVSVPDRVPPPQTHYDSQQLQAGFNYIRTRDGTLLSAFVTLPADGAARDGGFPTLVEYSGYSPSDPGADDAARFSLPLIGYALVQVNVRGTGCSGGIYDGFSEIERHDGYDVIETVAAQPWSAGIGMWGVSYPGIMQLHVAATRPPSLAAIAPLSVIGTIEDTLFPGGIFNNGFGQSWTTRVSESAEAFGQPWTRVRVDEGDSICESNQALRRHNPNLVEQALDSPYSTPLSRARSPESFVPEIDVPVYLAGAWQDEQTGGGFTQLLDDFSGTPSFRATLYNGLHIDPLGPDVLVPLLEFYDLYVAERVPVDNPIVALVVSAGSQAFFGETLDAPSPSLTDLDYDEAIAEYESADPIRVLYEVGAAAPGLPTARFDQRFPEWPIVTDDGLGLWLGTAGILQVDPIPNPSTDSPIAAFTSDPGEGSRMTVSDPARIWTRDPGWKWERTAPENGSSFVSAPFEETVVLTGNAAANLHLRLPNGEPDADLEITISDIGPDGSETFIQSGWLRLSRRALDPKSAPLNPRITNIETDIDPLDAGETVSVSIGTLAFAHVVRSGHRLALTVDTPGASRAEWTFDVIPDPVEVEIFGGQLLLPAIAAERFDAPIPETAPPCGSLRAQPCRP